MIAFRPQLEQLMQKKEEKEHAIFVTRIWTPMRLESAMSHLYFSVADEGYQTKNITE